MVYQGTGVPSPHIALPASDAMKCPERMLDKMGIPKAEVIRWIGTHNGFGSFLNGAKAR
jgi:hypothetical protein